MTGSTTTERDELVESFLRWLGVERGRSRNTLLAYGRDLSAYRAWLAEKGTDLSSVTPGTVESYLEEFRHRRAARSSQARALASLRAFHAFLADEGHLTHDPTASVSGVKVPGGLPKPLSVAEMERLLACMTGEDSLARRDRAVLEVLYATGARVSEVCGLDLGDLASDGATVRLRGKGGKERIVPLGSVAAEALGIYLQPGGRGTLASRNATQRTDRDAVFLSVRGRRLTRQKVHEIVGSAASRAGLDGRVSPHVFRHSCATHMLEHGADMRVVQEMLGHASISTTQVYTKVSQAHLVETFRRTHPRAEGPP